MPRVKRAPRRRATGTIRPHLALALLIVGIALPMALAGLPARPPAPLSAQQARENLLHALPPELSPPRRALVTSAADLVGRVGYFWGGKSGSLSWDARWGIPAVVRSPGSDSTGASRPFGLDCSGYVSWAAVNAAGTAAALTDIGNGVRAQWHLCTPVPWEAAQPGDLAFFPDLSHVGIVAGRAPDGSLSVLHCSSSLGGVVCSPDGAAVGFTAVGSPAFYNLYS